MFQKHLYLLAGLLVGTGITYGYYNFDQDASRRGKGFAADSAAVCQTEDIVSAEPVESVDQSALLQKSDPNADQNMAAAAAYLKFRQIKKNFMPSGVPAVYGQELDISFDKVQDAINKVRVFGPTYGLPDKKIVLAGADLERYVAIGSQIACEYCCNATTLVFENGIAACGCAHSQMMRGLAAYLIKNHPELSDGQILEELSLWKRTYFPKQTLSKELDSLIKSGEPGIEQILKEFPDFLPQMVGGC